MNPRQISDFAFVTEVSEFLRVTLDQEKLSKNAQICRQQLIAKIALNETSPTPEGYMDMHRKSNIQHKAKHILFN